MKEARRRLRPASGAMLLCAAALLPAASVAQADERVRYPSDATYTRTGHIHYYDACYYQGRCSADDLRRLRDRLQRLDRVTPQPPEAATPAPALPRFDVPPTPESHIQPAYREASQLRDAYREKAK